MPKPKQFTAANPLVVRIFKTASGGWDIEPHPNHHNAMQTRLNDADPAGTLQQRIDNEYVARKHSLAPPHPHFIQHAPHDPAIMREGEFVQFICDPPYAFRISSDRDPNVNANPAAPSNPFGWTGTQSVAPGGSISAAVLMPPVDANGNATSPGPREQGFYKFHAFVDDEKIGQTVSVDPDGYCDR